MATTYNDNGGAVNGSNKEYTFSFAYIKTEDVMLLFFFNVFFKFFYY